MSEIAIVRDFNGGMTADGRAGSSKSQLCKNFDTFTKSHSLIPYRSSEAAYVAQSVAKLQNFLMHDNTMYALGVRANSGSAAIIGNSSVPDPVWFTPANAELPGGSTAFSLFIEYHDTFYGASTGTSFDSIWAYTPATSVFVPAATQITYVNDPVGLVHSKDDILYIGFDNKIIKKDFASSSSANFGWLNPALTLPSSLVITSMCEYGNFIAVLCRNTQLTGHSKVFLWNRDSSLATLSESIDLGNLVGYVIESIDGFLITVSLSSNTLASIRPKMVFKRYVGSGGFKTFQEIVLASGPNTIVGKQKANNRLYFGLNASSYGNANSNDYVGVWSVGRNSENAPFSVDMAQLPENNATVQFVRGFIIAEDYFYLSYVNAAGDFALSKTNDADVFNVTSVYRTTINPGMVEKDKVHDKKLHAAALIYDKFPVNGRAVLKYVVDGSVPKAIFLEETAGARVSEMPNAQGEEFTNGRDFDFTIESTGGVEIGGLAYSYDTTETHL